MTVFLLRIKKLEKERMLILQCKRNGWTDVCNVLEEYEKVLENEKDTESKSFYSSQHQSCFTFNEPVFQYWWYIAFSGSVMQCTDVMHHLGGMGATIQTHDICIFLFRDAASKPAFKDQE